MKSFYLAVGKDCAVLRYGRLVILSNEIRVFVEKREWEWRATELLTGLLIPLKDENKTKLRLCLLELDEIQDRIYEGVRRVFSSTELLRQISPIMKERGFEDGELNDICYYAKQDISAEFLTEYKRLCWCALEWAKGIGKEENERIHKTIY